MASDTTRSRKDSGKSGEKEEKTNKDVLFLIQFMKDMKSKEVKKAQKTIKKILKLMNIKENCEKFVHGLPNDAAINNTYTKFSQDLFDGVNNLKCPHCGSK
jgi:hypothetical protein